MMYMIGRDTGGMMDIIYMNEPYNNWVKITKAIISKLF
jgi:hypothetical protein